MKEMNSEYGILMDMLFRRFEAETSEEAREILAGKIIEIYDQIDRYVLSEEEDEYIYAMYTQCRVFLQDTDFWDEPELLPLF